MCSGACVGFAVGIALRSVKCAGNPANAGGTAEAASFVPKFGEERRFLLRKEIIMANLRARSLCAVLVISFLFQMLLLPGCSKSGSVSQESSAPSDTLPDSGTEKASENEPETVPELGTESTPSETAFIPVNPPESSEPDTAETPAESDHQDDYGKDICLTEGFTDRFVTDADSAIQAAADAAPVLGLQDAEEELAVQSINTVDDVTYYRMQQYYEGIPVYGRTLTLAAEESGAAVLLSSNYTSISGNSVIGSISPETAAQSLRDYFLDESVLYCEEPDESNLVYFDLDEEPARLAYLIRVITSQCFYDVILDAADGRVLLSDCLLRSIDAEVVSEDGSVATTGWLTDYDIFELKNNNYHISVFDVHEQNLFVEAAETVSKRPKEKDQLYSDLTEYGLSVLRSEDNRFNTDAVRLLDITKRISDYYREVLGDIGFDSVHVGIHYSVVKNACGGSESVDGKQQAIILIGTKTGTQSPGLIAHEYSHGVFHKINDVSGTKYSFMTRAINEAYSDIIGELIESEITGNDPDWCMRCDSISLYRDMIGSEETKRFYSELNPEEQEKYIYHADQYREGMDGHYASTFLSHAAYLMWNGIDGTESKRIGSHLLAKLWYRSLYLLHTDTTFEQFANAVILTAEQMQREGRLTPNQIRCITEAFHAVGLAEDMEDPTEASYVTVNSQSTVLVSAPGQTGRFEYYGNYQLTVETLNLGSRTASEYLTVDVSDENGYALTLPEGQYRLTVRDNAENGSPNAFSKTVRVVPFRNDGQTGSGTKLYFYTDFRAAVNLAAEYLELIEQYEQEYGVCCAYPFRAGEPESAYAPVGLLYAELMDFDGNGVEELCLTVCTVNVYNGETGTGKSAYYYKGYRMDIWGISDGRLQKLYSEQPNENLDSGEYSFDCISKNEQTYLIRNYPPQLIENHELDVCWEILSLNQGNFERLSCFGCTVLPDFNGQSFYMADEQLCSEEDFYKRSDEWSGSDSSTIGSLSLSADAYTDCVLAVKNVLRGRMGEQSLNLEEDLAAVLPYAPYLFILKKTAFEEHAWNYDHGVLFDADQDGRMELFLLYSKNDMQIVGAVYRIGQNGLEAVIPEKELSWIAGGGPNAGIGVLQTEEGAFYACYGGYAEEFAGGHNWYLYSMTPGYPLQDFISYQWVQDYSFDPVTYEPIIYGTNYTITRNGTEISKESYDQWEASLDHSLMIGFGAETLGELCAEICGVPVAPLPN